MKCAGVAAALSVHAPPSVRARRRQHRMQMPTMFGMRAALNVLQWLTDRTSASYPNGHLCGIPQRPHQPQDLFDQPPLDQLHRSNYETL